MTRTEHSNCDDPLLSAAERIERTRRQFVEKWKEAFDGGTPPQVETFVREHLEADRATLRAELERIDQIFRQRRELRVPGEITDDQSGSRRADAPEKPGATVQMNADPPPTSPATTVAGGVRSAPPAKSSLGTLQYEIGGPPADIRIEPRTVERPSVPGYEILSELGRGGMGVVYRAKQIKLNRVVALKMVLAGAHASPEQLARFYTEAQAVAHLQHPNIVQIYEVSEQAGLPFFSLEYVDAGSLADRTNGRPQPVIEAAQMVKTLTDAMHYAHEHGVVHRDLKPANVLLTSEGVPKITDFGLAKRLEDESSSQTRSGAILGTPSYMAPEQAIGAVHKIGPLTDVYTLGAILYELLTGRPPFVGPTPMDTVVQVTRDEPVPPTQLQPKVPKDIETICVKCLQKESTKRYASAGELAGDLGRFLRGEPILARPISATERLWRWCRRNPRVATLSAAVLMLLVTVAVVSTVMAVRIQHARELAVEAQKLAEQHAESARLAQAVAEHNEETAKQEHQKAERNAQVASEQGMLALRTLYDLVNAFQNELKDMPGLQELKQQLLDMALTRLDGVEAGLDKVGHGADGSELALRAAAGAYQRGGTIMRDLGQIERALEKYKRCHQIVLEMEKSNPQNPIYKRNMAASFNNLASISERLGDVVSAREYYRQALEARERWSALDPASHEATWQTANSHLLLGQVSLYTGDPALALQAFAEAANLRQSIPADSVERVMYDQEWAWQHDRMAEASIRLGNLAEARQHYDTSLELRKKLVDAAAPRSGVQLRRDLASSYLKIGDMSFLFDKDLNQAEAYYQQSLNVCEELRALDPRNSDVRADLATTHYKLGSLKQHLGLAASKEHYQECLAIRAKLAAAAAQDQMAQADLMLAMARCGQHAKAAVIAERLREQLPQNPAIQYQVACCYAISMGDIAAEAAADSNDAQQLAEKYRASAIEAIRQAIASGWKDLVTIRTNPELDPIRQLEEFQRVTHAPQ